MHTFSSACFVRVRAYVYVCVCVCGEGGGDNQFVWCICPYVYMCENYCYRVNLDAGVWISRAYKAGKMRRGVHCWYKKNRHINGTIIFFSVSKVCTAEKGYINGGFLFSLFCCY